MDKSIMLPAMHLSSYLEILPVNLYNIGNLSSRKRLVYVRIEASTRRWVE
jgi:hypothetical protein